MAVILLYEAAMIAMMLALVLPARAGVERYGDAVAGGVIAAMGLTVMSLGI